MFSILLATICGFLLGFGDACWNTQIFAFLISRYLNQSAQAFSLFKFFQSLFASITFYYSNTIQLHYHLIVLVIGSIAGAIGFYLADVPLSAEYDIEDYNENEERFVIHSD